MKIKVCFKCGLKGDEDLFLKGRNVCKECKRAQDKKWRDDNIDEVRRKARGRPKNKQARKEWLDNNPDKVKEHRRKFRENNREKRRLQSREYAKNNRDKRIAYYEKNRDKINAKRRAKRKERQDSDPLFRLRKTVSRAILHALNKRKSSKNGHSIMDFLPYSIEELAAHLEKTIFIARQRVDELGKPRCI
jgi:hypothetical protein